MPLVDGLEFLRRLRTRTMLRSTPVMIVTGDYLIDDSTTTALSELGARVAFKRLFVDSLAQIVRERLGCGEL